MAPNDLLALPLAAAAGMALGAFFFVGLWWTVRGIVRSSRPALLQFSSLMVRMAVTLAGFHIAGGGDARRLVACLAGFAAARLLVARSLRALDREAPRATRP